MAGSSGEDLVYVAVGNDINECKLNLVYAIKHSGGRRICILHVHEPAKFIPICKARKQISICSLNFAQPCDDFHCFWWTQVKILLFSVDIFCILTKMFLTFS